MMAIADPFFEATTPITLPAAAAAGRSRPAERLRARLRRLPVLINQFQVAISVRLNFFQNDFGNAIQVADEAASRRLLASVDLRFRCRSR